ncbi:MAG: FxsA family protein [Campylobacterota bacterium]|nr:FxsA family protein [Campylobacterota bacterium]
MIYFILYLFLEVLVSVNISSEIGGLATFGEIVASAFIGIYILFHFQATLGENMRAVSAQEINLQKFQELNIFTLLGAVLLIIPGFLTDIIGILLQFHVFTSMLVNRFSAKFNSKPKEQNSNHTKDDNVIDVEIISDSITRN